VPPPRPNGEAAQKPTGGLRSSALTRKAPLKRSTPISRGDPPKRTRPPKRRRRRLSARERRERQLFQEHAATQQRCANCASTGAWHAHHAGVYEQKLRHLGLPLWDPANALRLCLACHAKHHSPNHKLTLSVLRAQNIRYAFDVLGERAYEYLRRRYQGADPRLERERQKRSARHAPQPQGGPTAMHTPNTTATHTATLDRRPAATLHAREAA
jgi:hypothetical protein